jgi:hypothetical protein
VVAATAVVVAAVAAATAAAAVAAAKATETRFSTKNSQGASAPCSVFDQYLSGRKTVTSLK